MEAQRIGVFVTGGIAAYKVPLIVRGLIQAGHEVRVVMTEAAHNFVTAQTLATVSKHPVLTEAHEFDAPEHVAHVALAHWMDMALVVPATANTLAKLAAGLADNVVTTTLLAFSGPKLLVPAMNDQMWLNQQTQANITHLQALGMTVLPPATGFLAEGYQAVGRMPEPAVIQLFVSTWQAQAFLAGKKVLVTAGGTKERLDPVRYLSNDSSGKMGTALANVAASAGAAVTLVTTKTQPVLPQVQVVRVESAQELADAVQEAFVTVDVAIMAAAVADYRAATVAPNKMKKTSPTQGLTLALAQTPDILAGLGRTKTHQYVVGFAAETTDLIANAEKKLTNKRVDLLVANPVGHGQGFDQDDNQGWLLRPNQAPEALPLTSKVEMAATILKAVGDALD